MRGLVAAASGSSLIHLTKISEAAMAGDGDDDEAKYAQAVRFLASLRSQKNQDVETQRSFLQSKGLSEEVIARAFEDVKRPEGISEEAAASQLAVTPTNNITDDEAFEQAAKMFDDPITAQAGAQDERVPDTPPKTYPRSPLALYHQPQPGQQQQMFGPPPQESMTRYDVLLAFFRSLCYFLVLGGGVTGAVVALYRAYLLPRMVSTLDSRSYLLKHHVEQFNVVANRIKSLRNNSIAPNSQQGLSTPLKGVLKKVQFADDVGANERQSFDEEDVKESGDRSSSTAAQAATTEKSPLLQEEKEQGQGENMEGAEEALAEESAPAIKPIDVLEPVRSSLVRLSQSLRGEPSLSQEGPSSSSTTSRPAAVTSSSAHATTVEEENDADSWVSEEDDSDELEFDPYSPTSSSSSKKKHDPATTPSASSRTSSGSSSSTSISLTDTSSSAATALHSSLSTVNAYINSQTYMASANIFGGGRMYGAVGTSGASGNDKENGKAGDVAQIRADIRNLKGLLLSRRNFPTYRSQAQVNPSVST